ncbi:MAG: hypothetical protein FWD82_01450 [Defluviitaleaceae bacterium]|nr:hypothetical protein [Defluviitaleaceae bacterium]
MNIYFVLLIAPIFGEELIEEKVLTPRLFFLPGLSYEYVAFDNLQFHNPSSSLTMLRINPNEPNRLSVFSLRYNPNILNNQYQPEYPNLFHNIAFTGMQRVDRHFFICGFMPITERPLFGGSRSYMGMAIYSYNLVNREHFTMNLGMGLLLMDIGVRLNNGSPWMLWPIPTIGLSWEYEWINFSLIPGARLVIAPQKPVSLVLINRSREFDVSLWYRYFRDGTPSNEVLGIGFGVTNQSNNVMLSDGTRYGIIYNTIYGAVRLFRIFEINGGWAFNGRSGEGNISADTLFDSFGYSGRPIYNNDIGNGFFASISARINTN